MDFVIGFGREAGGFHAVHDGFVFDRIGFGAADPFEQLERLFPIDAPLAEDFA